jgi:hypothetical protein
VMNEWHVDMSSRWCSPAHSLIKTCSHHAI